MSTDMSSVIVAKSDQINADDLIAGPRVVTIASVKINPGTEQPVQMALEGTDKLFRPCKTVSRVIVALWGADASQYVGKSLRLFRDPSVTWAGVKVGGIRIDQASHIDGEKSLVVKESQKVSKLHKIRPLVVEQKVDEAAVWAETQIAAIKGATDIEALDRVMTLAAKGIAKLRANRTELSDKIGETEERRRDELANPAASEGRDQTDMGDGFTDDQEFVA